MSTASTRLTAEAETTKPASTSAMGRMRRAFVVLDLAVNLAAPALIFKTMHGHWGDVPALLASSVPPLLWGVGSFARHRRMDAVSLLAMAGIALSLLAFVGGGSAHMLELRENLVTLLIGLAFLGSAAIGKPLIYPLARATMARESGAAVAEFDARRNEAPVRHTVMVMTLVWGFGLVTAFAMAVVLIYTLSIADYLTVGPFLTYGAMGGLTLWTMLYRRYRTRLIDAQGS